MLNLLPIGSIVKLKEGKKKLMIYGRVQFQTDKQKMYDYIGCLYPEGSISNDINFLFNHEDILEIIFKGYTDEEENEFLTKVEEYMKKNGIK